MDSKFGSSWGGWCSLECLGWGYEKILGRVGENYLVILDSRWEMDSRLDSGMICGVGM